MAIQTSTDLSPKNEEGFALAQGKHLKDVIILVDDNTARDALPSPVKVEGVIVFSKAENKLYQYVSSAWVEKSLGAIPSNGLTTLPNGDIGLGGTLTEAFTVIDGDGNSLFVTNFGGLNFFSQGFLSLLTLSGGTTQLIGENTIVRGGTTGLTSQIEIIPSSMTFSGRPLTIINDEVQLRPLGDVRLRPGSGDGRAAIYDVIPTILADESVPAWKNVKELYFTFLAFTVDSSSNDSAHVTFRGQIEIDDTSETKDDYISSVKWQIRSVATSNVFIFPPAGDTLSDLATYIDTNIGATDKFSVRPVPIYTGSGLGSVGFDYKILYR